MRLKITASLRCGRSTVRPPSIALPSQRSVCESDARKKGDLSSTASSNISQPSTRPLRKQKQNNKDRKKRVYDSILPKDLSSLSVSLDEHHPQNAYEESAGRKRENEGPGHHSIKLEKLSEMVLIGHHTKDDASSFAFSDARAGGQDWIVRVYSALAHELSSAAACEELLLWDALQEALGHVLPHSAFTPSNPIEERTITNLVKKRITNWMSNGKGRDDVDGMLKAELVERHERWQTVEHEEMMLLCSACPENVQVS